MPKKKAVTHRIPYAVWINSQLSVARHYGGMTFNGKHYEMDKTMPDTVGADGVPRWFPDLVTFE